METTGDPKLQESERAPEPAQAELEPAREPPTMVEMLVASFRALPRWKKVLGGASFVFIWPLWLFIAIVTALSYFPLVLVGRWVGAPRDRPLLREVKHLARRYRGHTREYYAH